MTCPPLPNTGLDADVSLLLLLAIALITAGTAIVFLARRRGRGTTLVLAMLLLFATATTLTTVGIQAPAQAATSGCSSSSDNRLTVTQTSTMERLAPGIKPVPITGRLVNNSEDSTYVTAVDVEITSITLGPGSSAGACGPSDYRLSAARMRVGESLRPGGSTPFTGASIGFANKTSNQDACQGALIHLLYTANPN